jgi:hypothetical protein
MNKQNGEDYDLLGCNTILFRQSPAFQRSIELCQNYMALQPRRLFIITVVRTSNSTEWRSFHKYTKRAAGVMSFHIHVQKNIHIHDF